MGRYVRRITEESYAHIEEEATRNDGSSVIDWAAVGQAAAHRALAAYGAGATPERAIDASSKAVESGHDPSAYTAYPGS